MKTIHISQFYPCSKVELAVELQYIVELSKYLQDYDYALSVDGVEFDKVLRKSRFWDYFRVAVDKEEIIDCFEEDIEISIIDPVDYGVKLKNVKFTTKEIIFDNDVAIRRRNDMEFNYRTPELVNVAFTEQTPQYWSWALMANIIVNNSTLNCFGGETNWISFIAFVAVERLMTGQPNVLLIELCNQVMNTSMLLSNFMLLMEMTDACKWCKYFFTSTVTDKMKNHLGYQAWYMRGKELGYLNRWYSPTEKNIYMNKLHIRRGSVVYLYERRFGQRLDPIKSIEGFSVAVVEKITADGVTFTVVNNKKTKSQGEIDWEDYTMLTKSMYNFENPFNKPNTSTVVRAWNDLGVEYAMHGEKYFITPVNNDDYREVHIGDEDNRLYVKLPSAELTYWILKDYEIEFDEQRFVKEYINQEPLYEMFKRTGVLPDEYILQEVV